MRFWGLSNGIAWLEASLRSLRFVKGAQVLTREELGWFFPAACACILIDTERNTMET